MKVVPHLTDEAAEAIVDQADYYRQEGGELLERRWYLAIDKAVRSVAAFPLLGMRSPLVAPGRPGLRFVHLPDFHKFLKFCRYSEADELLTIVHFLHRAREVEFMINKPAS